MSTEQILLIANSNTLELNGLRNAVAGGFVNTATVVATLEDAKGNEVTGQVWPAILNYVADSNGCYQLLLDAGLTLIKDKRYKLILTAQGDGLTANWETFIQAKVRH